VLPPGKRRKAKAINVLPPGNAGNGNKRSTATGAKATGECYHRGNVIRRKP